MREHFMPYFVQALQMRVFQHEHPTVRAAFSEVALSRYRCSRSSAAVKGLMGADR